MICRTSRIGVLGLAVSAMLVAGSTAQAGLLSANSGGAMPGFTGTQLFDVNFSGFTVSANVDFAVFAPGAFGVAFPGEDTSGGTDYVYAYQIHNLDSDVTKLTVGLDGDEALGTIGFIGDAGLLDPSTDLYVGVPPTSSAWDFNPRLVINQSSAVLFFTSKGAPELHSATVSAGWFNSHDLPSPLPEPASLTLLALGAGVMCLGKRRRS